MGHPWVGFCDNLGTYIYCAERSDQHLDLRATIYLADNTCLVVIDRSMDNIR